MGLSAAEIAAVVGETEPVLNGGWIQKIFQPTPLAITLEVRVPGQTLSLLLSADPDTARLHLVSQRLPNPPSPPAFCQFLRAHVQGARIDGLEQLPGDRIVRLSLTARQGPCSLLAELTGRHADLLLLDHAGKILATIGEERDRLGTHYQPPAPPPRPDDDEVEPFPTPTRHNPFPVSALLEQRYQQQEDTLAIARARRVRLAELRKTIKKAARRIEALRTDLDKAARYRDYARYGELLKAHLGRIKKGQEQITVVDYFDPAQPELVIPLDPSKGPQGNMDDYFKKHRKYLVADQEIKPRIEQAERELATLRAEQKAIQQGTWAPRGPLVPLSQTRRKKATSKGAQARSGPFRRFTSADGLPIYMGRNARENEDLTFTFARSDDLWLHAHGSPGSHVVVRLEKGANPPPETLRDAATLALLYSDLKKSGKGEVIYARRKYVREAKGRAPGTVTVTQEKSLFIALDKTRLEAMKERSR